MSQKVPIAQTSATIANIGANTKTVAQLIADYPNAKEGEEVLSTTELYKCLGPGQWLVLSPGSGTYAEGDFSAALGAANPKASTASGYYVRHNRVVSLNLYVAFGDTSGDNADIEIKGLPFQGMDDAGTGQNCGGFTLVRTSSARRDDLFNLYYSGLGAASDYIQVLNGNWPNPVPYSAYSGSFFTLTGFYFTKD